MDLPSAYRVDNPFQPVLTFKTNIIVTPVRAGESLVKIQVPRTAAIKKINTFPLLPFIIDIDYFHDIFITKPGN